MLSTPDKTWLRATLPLITEDASAVVDACKAAATNPFVADETLFGRTNQRAKFWAELGRIVAEHLTQQWTEGALTLKEAAFLSQSVSSHLFSENQRVCALARHFENTKPAN